MFAASTCASQFAISRERMAGGTMDQRKPCGITAIGAQGREESSEAPCPAARAANAIARPGACLALAAERIAVAHAAGMPAPLHGRRVAGAEAARFRP